ncbi:MAG: hypothetical protein EXR34_09535 [Rhodoferax sp.]|nr:hypothetical protein [Rhodoferax sp.]
MATPNYGYEKRQKELAKKKKKEEKLKHKAERKVGEPGSESAEPDADQPEGGEASAAGISPTLPA